MPSKNTPARRKSFKSFLLKIAFGTPLAASLGWIAYSNTCISHRMPLPPAVSGQRHVVYGRTGKLSYYVAGRGKPMLLIHSINAAPSVYEMRPVFEHYRQTRRVYAVDLPGFGFSERSKREYTPRIYTNAVIEMLKEIERDSGQEPVDAMSISLGGEFLARAASEFPHRFRSLALVTPTGFRRGEKLYGEPESVRGNPLVRNVLSFPLWSRAFFDLLNSKPSQRYFLTRLFGSAETVDEGFLAYDYLTAHQPGAQYAPYSFVSGLLFSADLHHVYDALNLPVWIAYGIKGDFSNVEPQQVTARGWSLQAFPTGGMPYFEQTESFFAAYDEFLQQVTGR